MTSSRTSGGERLSGPDLVRALRGGRVDFTGWPLHGAAAAAIGFALAAAVFIAVDAWKATPFATPSALGSAIFLGQWPPPATAPSLILVLGYAAIHAGTFIGFAAMAACLLALTRRPLPAVALAILLFAWIETTFLALGVVAAIFLRDSWAAGAVLLGWGVVAAANALAAVGIAAYLRWFAWPRALRRPPD